MLPVRVQREAVEGTLREVVETLAPLDRTPCSSGEREAAEWLARKLREAGDIEVALEDEPSWGTFPPTATGLGAIGLLGAWLALRGRGALAALLGLVGLAGIVDEAQNGPRVLRRLVRRKRSTVNVIGRAGDREALETVVVIAHHDAPQTGVLFDQTLQRRLYELSPERIGRAKTSFPQWWIGLAAPLGAIATALTGRRAPARAGFALGMLGTGLVADLWRNRTVPGANDNLSGVACLVALAERLRAEPIAGLRVLLVSCGAEETLQDGIRAFVARHRAALDPQRTCFVNLDTVGSPHLIMLEAEGPIWMEEHAGGWLRDLLADSAERLGIGLERGFRARSSTDSVIPSRAGYPIATLASITAWRSLANYHLPSDTPENLDYGTVADATLLVDETLRTLAAQGTGARAPDRGSALRS
jgi:hypothetical protein